MRLNFNAAHYSVKLKKDEKLLLEHLGVRETPRHRDIFYGLTSLYATEEEAKQACEKHAAKLHCLCH